MNQKHLVTVKIVKFSGIEVVLENGEQAWLPNRELCLDFIAQKEKKFSSICKAGDVFEVVAYGYEIGGQGRLLVSKIRVNNDPWEKVKNWNNKTIKNLEIYAVSPARAYGSIEPGIEGYIDLQEFDDFIKSKKIDNTWADFFNITVGDVVIGYINDIDAKSRIIKLDIIKYFSELDNIAPELTVVDLKQKIHSTNKLDINDNLYNNSKHQFNDIKNVLLIDDYKPFCEELKDFFKEYGIKTVIINSAQEFKKYLRSEIDGVSEINLAIFDIHLGREDKDHKGIKLAIEFSELYPDCRIILTTGENEISKTKSCNNLKINYYLEKPFGVIELREAIIISLTKPPRPISDFITTTYTHNNIPHLMEHNDDEFYSIINDLKEDIDADAVVLFQMHPISKDILILASNGNIQNLDVIGYKKRLPYSPVKDVSIEGQEIFENDITTTFLKHKVLWYAINYESIIAFPIKSHSEYGYSIFAFSKNKNAFNKQHQIKTFFAAHKIELVLKEIKSREYRRINNPFIITGKIYSMIAHELKTKTSTQNIYINNIIKKLNNFQKLDNNDIKDLKNKAKNLMYTIDSSIAILKIFVQLAASQNEEEKICYITKDIDDLVDSIENLSIEEEVNILKNYNNLIETNIKLKINSLLLIISNLIINALQQIKNFKFVRKKGEILIDASLVKNSKENYLHFIIHDNGPGIHKYNFKRIFETSFSTKQEGSGLGLDICKTIAQENGWQIGIKKSILFIGSSFEIKVPIEN